MSAFKKQFGSILANIALMSFSVFLVLFVAEVGLRTHRSLTQNAHPIRHDPELGYILEPSSTWKVRTDEFQTTITTNSEGFRGPEFPPREKPADEKRILILGDSFVEASEVAEEERFGRVLEQKLQNTNAILLGVAGISPIEELNYYRKLGRDFHPDVVVLQFYSHNDLVFPTDGTFTTVGSGDNMRIAHINTKVHESWRAELGRKFMVVQLVYNAIKRDLPQLWEEQSNEESVKKGIDMMWSHTKQGFAELSENGTWDTTMAVFRTLKEEVERDGAELVVLVISSPLAIQEERAAKLKEDLKEYVHPDDWNVTGVTNGIVSRLESDGFTVIDTTERLRTETEEGKQVYFEFDQHITKLGHEIVAEMLYEVVQESLK